MGDLALVRLEAEEAERKEDWQRASQLRDAVALRSPRTGFWDRLFAVRAAARAGRIEDASSRLRLLAVVPGGESAWAMTRAEIEERLGRDGQAVEWWRKVVQMEPDPYWALFGLSRSLHRLGEAAEARRTMACAMALPAAEREGARFAAVLDLQHGCLEDATARMSAFGLSGDDRIGTILSSRPGMTSQAERFTLYRAARSLAGVGQIVDLGCWLGSLTVSMALGAEENPRILAARARIHAYDAFVWLAAHMDHNWVAGLPLVRPEDGASFLPVFQRLTAPWTHLIDVHPGDLASSRWSAGPIELLSVDAMKSPELAATIVAQFYPALVSGQSLLFHQDYCHGYTWWIHLHQFLLRDHFDLIDNLPGSAGMLFRLVRPFESGELARVSAADLSNPQLASDAFAYSMSLVAPGDRATIAAARISCDLAHHRTAEAIELMEQYRDDAVVDRELNWASEWKALKATPRRT